MMVMYQWLAYLVSNLVTLSCIKPGCLISAS